MNEPKYPNVKVKLVGEDGNAFSIIGRVSGALRKAKVSRDEVASFTSEAMSGDYDHVLCTAMNWVSVDDDDDEETHDEENDDDYCVDCEEDMDDCSC